MSLIDVIKRRFLGVLLITSMVVSGGCGLFGGRGASGDGGELYGVLDRPVGWVMTQPYGMNPIPAGTFHMGQADEDVPATMINFNKQITIGPFLIDDTEITNNEYRQFIVDIMEDSLDVLGEQFIYDELYPDTTAWTRDFTYHMGDPMMEYYFLKMVLVCI